MSLPASLKRKLYEPLAYKNMVEISIMADCSPVKGDFQVKISRYYMKIGWKGSKKISVDLGGKIY